MILVLSGTGDGRWITRELAGRGYRVNVMVSTSYGRELAYEDGAEQVLINLPGKNWAWLRINNVHVLVDARHPFAREDSGKLAHACKEHGVLYLAVGREETTVQSDGPVLPVYSMQEAAEKAAGLGKTIFLTTGSHGLEHFTRIKTAPGMRLVVRVLPEHRVIKKCQDLGIKPKDIVAMQGPFSKQINRALFKMYRASVVVTKDSGRAGGTDTKIEAALSLKIPVVLVKHPRNGGREHTRNEVVEIIRREFAPGSLPR